MLQALGRAGRGRCAARDRAQECSAHPWCVGAVLACARGSLIDCCRRWWDSGSHWSMCGGCVVDRGPPNVRAGGGLCGGGGVRIRWSARRRWDSGGHPSLCGGCVVGSGPSRAGAGGRRCSGDRGYVAWCKNWWWGSGGYFWLSGGSCLFCWF
jgi:hypothetical protein